ncbi:tigger transposable element-derived protein 6-like [Lineus longissimus]|uniref:tigger transposable element-derived protein 6-like n=1 Tax=Lineus longissimus TaxID=88925 RepID=UPI00315D8D8F
MPTQSKPRPARRELQLKDKIKLIKAKDSEGKSCRQLAEMFDIGKTQVSTVLKRKAEYLDAYEENAPTERKRLNVSSELQDVDDLTWKWFQQARSHSLPVSGPMIQEIARQIALGLDKKDFKASNGWLEKWKTRHNINQVTICGESESVDDNMVDEWKKKLPELVAGYDPKDIFNMDETGLFYCALPCKTLRVRGDECKGGKKSKDRITASLCVNLEGDFEQTLIIGKSANPRCFRNLSKRHLPIAWEHNKKAWMTGEIFGRWVKSFNTRMRLQGRHVLLFIDNAPSHPKYFSLSNVKIIFLPANTTSKLQPLDQGIIAAIKKNYRRRLLQAVLLRMDKEEDISKLSKCVSVLDACEWVTAAVKEVKSTTVRACFARSGFTDDVIDEDPEDNLPLAQLIQEAQIHFGIDDIMDVEDYIGFDGDTAVTDDVMEGYEQRLLEEFRTPAATANAFVDDQVRTAEIADDDENETAEPECEINSNAMALHYASQLRLFCLDRDYGDVFQNILKSETSLQERILDSKRNAKQTTLDSFFRH